MKCGLNNYWWQYPKHLTCEGSIKEPTDTNKRNGYGYWKICDGSIKLELGTKEIDGCYPEITVNFWCDKCGNGYYPTRDLPTDAESLHAWINNILSVVK